MALLVELKNGKELGKSYEIGSKPVFVGRLSTCDICLSSPAVSKSHAIFIEKNGWYGVKDLDSVNGIYINGKKINNSSILKSGDVIRIANFVFRFLINEKVNSTELKSNDQNKNKTLLLDALPDHEIQQHTESVAESKQSNPDNHIVTENLPKPATQEEVAGINSDFEIDNQSTLILETTQQENIKDQISGSDDSKSETDKLSPQSINKISNSLSYSEEMHGVDENAEEDISVDNGINSTLSQAMANENLSVGEFVPEVEEEVVESVVVDDSKWIDLIIDKDLEDAVNKRLELYAFLRELSEERKSLLENQENLLTDAVRVEYLRQEKEMENIPSGQSAVELLARLKEKKENILKSGSVVTKQGKRVMTQESSSLLEAVDMGVMQVNYIIQSESTDYPEVLKKTANLFADEGLFIALQKAAIDLTNLFASSIYYFTLEKMADEVVKKRKSLRDKLDNVSTKNVGKKKRNLFSIFRKSSHDADTTNVEDEQGETEDFSSLDTNLTNRSLYLSKELAWLSKRLIEDFWTAYNDVALFYAKSYSEISAEDMKYFRAFIRHGAIGFKAWWMAKELSDYILSDCENSVVVDLKPGINDTIILYIDEYFKAIIEDKCSAAIDEDLELNYRNTPNWKVDKAQRRLIYANTQLALLKQLLDSMRKKYDDLIAKIDSLEVEISSASSKGQINKKTTRELQQKQQILRVESGKLKRNISKIEEHDCNICSEMLKDVEDKFVSGELVKFSVDFMISRECRAIRRISKLLANLKEVFLPLVIRDYYKLSGDTLNSREAITESLADIEKKDPGIFLQTLNHAKRQKDQVNLRISPTILIIPSAGILNYAWNPRAATENGRLAIPSCFIRSQIKSRQMIFSAADFRWDTSKASAALDILTSDTIVAAFMTVRWEWRKKSREAREKGLVFNEQNDRTNWRRVYDSYMQSAFDGGRKLYFKNYDFYARIIGKYFILPEGVPLLKK